LKLKCDDPLSNFAVNFNLHPYSVGSVLHHIDILDSHLAVAAAEAAGGRQFGESQEGESDEDGGSGGGIPTDTPEDGSLSPPPSAGRRDRFYFTSSSER